MGETLGQPVEILRWSGPRREFLVSVRASSGGGLAWVDYAKPRSWDLLLNYYDGSPALLPGAEIVTVGGVSKFPAVWETDRMQGGFLAGYRAAMFVDDDIELQFEDLDRLFGIVTEFSLALAQPSLSHRSHHSWPITLHCPSYRLRYTNFVEIMAPVFSAAALARCLPTFQESASGWGLDLIWPALLGNPTDAIAIIDEIEMTHNKAVDARNGRFYQYLQSLGVDANEEASLLTAKYGVSRDYPVQQFSGVPAKAAAPGPADG